MTKEEFKILAHEKTDEELIEIKKQQEDYQLDFIYYVDEEIKNRHIQDSAFTIEEDNDLGEDNDNEYVEFDNAKQLEFEETTNEDLCKLFLELPEDSNPDYLQSLVQEMKTRKLLTKDIENQRKKMLDESRFNKKGSLFGIVLGYLFSFLGGLVGFIIAGKYGWSKKTDYLGKEQFIYNEATRQHAKNMVIINTIVIVIVLLIKFA